MRRIVLVVDNTFSSDTLVKALYDAGVHEFHMLREGEPEPHTLDLGPPTPQEVKQLEAPKRGPSPKRMTIKKARKLIISHMNTHEQFKVRDIVNEVGFEGGYATIAKALFDMFREGKLKREGEPQGGGYIYSKTE